MSLPLARARLAATEPMTDQVKSPSIAAFVDEGVVTWPTLHIDRDALARHLTTLAPESLGHAGDLALTFACTTRSEPAIRLLDPILRSAVAAATAKFDASPGFADDVAQKLREKLLLSEPPRIGTYAGRAPLRAWLRMAGVRAALNLRRRREEDGRARAVLTTSCSTTPGDTDLEYLRARYRGEFAAALKSAVAHLPKKDRRMLRAYVVERETLETIAKGHDVGISTISRWLQAIRERVALDTKTALRDGLGLTTSEYEGIAELVHRDLDVSVAGMLKSSTA